MKKNKVFWKGIAPEMAPFLVKIHAPTAENLLKPMKNLGFLEMSTSEARSRHCRSSTGDAGKPS